MGMTNFIQLISMGAMVYTFDLNWKVDLPTLVVKASYGVRNKKRHHFYRNLMNHLM